MDVIHVADDYCDACTAEARVQAFVYADHPDWPASIGYCGHHGTEYLPELTRTGATIIDMRHQVHE